MGESERFREERIKSWKIGRNKVWGRERRDRLGRPGVNGDVGDGECLFVGGCSLSAVTCCDLAWNSFRGQTDNVIVIVDLVGGDRACTRALCGNMLQITVGRKNPSGIDR